MVLGEQLPESTNSPHSGGAFSWIASLRSTIGGILGEKAEKETVEQPATITRNIDGYVVTLKLASFSSQIPGLGDDEVATFWVEKVGRETPVGIEEVSTFDVFNKSILVLPRDILSRNAGEQEWSSDPVDIVARSTLEGPASQEIAQLIVQLKNGEAKTLSPIERPVNTIILQQGRTTEAAFALVRGTVEILGNTEDGGFAHIRTVKSPAILGEISALRGGPATATVRTMTDCSLISIPKGTLIRLAERENWKPYFERLVEERLAEHTLALQQREERMERERSERNATGFSLNNTLAAALDLSSAEEEFDSMDDSDHIVRRSVTLRGIHRDTKEERTVEFHIAMHRNRNSDIAVHISLEPNAVPGDYLGGPGIVCDISRELGNAFLNEGYMYGLKGFGFYAQILPVMLRNIPITDSGVVNKKTRNFLSTQPKGTIIPSTVLAKESPVVASRKHGLSVMRGTGEQAKLKEPENASEPLRTYKVSANWQFVLILATELERMLSMEGNAYATARTTLEREYHEAPARIAQIVRRHAEDESESLLSLYESPEFQEAAKIQLARLMELSKRIGQRESKLLKQQKEMS